MVLDYYFKIILTLNQPIEFVPQMLQYKIF